MRKSQRPLPRVVISNWMDNNGRSALACNICGAMVVLLVSTATGTDAAAVAKLLAAAAAKRLSAAAAKLLAAQHSKGRTGSGNACGGGGGGGGDDDDGTGYNRGDVMHVRCVDDGRERWPYSSFIK